MSRPTTAYGRAIGEIERNNLAGARATMGTALKTGVERVVYTSSVLAAKPGAAAVDETSRHTPQSVIGAYKRSKLVAEREVERLIETESFPP
jgi:dihydroflavonol-4-reductase